MSSPIVLLLRLGQSVTFQLTCDQGQLSMEDQEKQEIKMETMGARWGRVEEKNRQIFNNLLVFLFIIVSYFICAAMDSWRFSYDAQKSKFYGPLSKTQNFSAYPGKPQVQKIQIRKNTDEPATLRKTNSYQISPLKSLQFSKSPTRENTLKYSPFKTPKPAPKSKTGIDSPEQGNLGQHKSSTITEDSESNEARPKARIIERCPTYCPVEQKQKEKSINMRRQKRQKNITEGSPSHQLYTPGRPSYRAGNKDREGREATDKGIEKYQGNRTKIDDFLFLSELGRGYNSVVYLARHKTLGMLFAIKILCKQSIKTDSLKQNIFRQIKIHSFIKNSNLLSLYKILDDQKYIYMVMEYATNGTLFSTLKKQKRFTEERTAKIVRDICRGLKYLHDNNIIHRDLKLENVLLTQGVAKIGDFGCAVFIFCMRKSKIGSPAYLSPEQLNHNFYGKKIDIWSLGIMVYEMLFQATPFDKEIIQALNKGQLNYQMKVKFPLGVHISEPARNFIEKCLEKKQNSRMDIDQVLAHPFLKLDQPGRA